MRLAAMVCLVACVTPDQLGNPEWGLEARPSNPTCVAFPRPVQNADIRVTRTFDLSWPRATSLQQPPGQPDWWWVTTSRGRIHRFANDPNVTQDELVVDLSGDIDSNAAEAGLLGLAFHPNFETNGYVYVNYTVPGLTTQIVRYTSSDGATINQASRRLILEVDQPYNNHNGGHLAFGPDGYLYFGLGDGGSSGDPGGNAQNTNTLLGSMLRIDVDGGNPYAIPPTNPFAAGGGRPEIFAWGLRNPWRFSFDAVTGDLWVGDVGQDAREEISIVRLGENHGWNVLEGDACYWPPEDCNDAGLTYPLAVHDHEEGDQSIIGGVVYRGSDIPGLVGTYVYADYISGRLYGIRSGVGDAKRDLLYELGASIVHIGESLDGELFLLDHNLGIYKVESSGEPVPVVNTVPERLSQTGCVDPTDPTRPGSMLIPYLPAHGFWSDNALKNRWFAIPDGTQITILPDGRFELPIGSVTVKEFVLGGALVETRLLVRHQDGLWAGYTYQWNGGDAELVPTTGADAVGGGGEPWEIPTRGECVQCHTGSWGGLLGMSSQQMDALQVYPNGAINNQLDLLVRLGMITGDVPRPGPFAAIDAGDAPLDARARAYLHVNCAFCHFEGGTGGGELDLRYGLSLAESGMCGEPNRGDLGLKGARIVTAGSPELSILYQRMQVRNEDQMPPIASEIVDDVGVELIGAWIRSLPDCPTPKADP